MYNKIKMWSLKKRKEKISGFYLSENYNEKNKNWLEVMSKRTNDQPMKTQLIKS
jgi:hypothetical protein